MEVYGRQTANVACGRTQSGRRRQGCEELVQTDRSITSPCMVQYVAMVHPTALRGMCVTVPRATRGNNAVRGSGVPRNFVRGGGSTNSVEDRGQRERGSGGGSPLVRGSGGSCNLVREISFHIVKFS